MSDHAEHLLELDLRALPPPIPLFRIHEALVDLPVGRVLVAHTPCRPDPLLDWLPANGYAYRVAVHEAGDATVRIVRDDAAGA